MKTKMPSPEELNSLPSGRVLRHTTGVDLPSENFFSPNYIDRLYQRFPFLGLSPRERKRFKALEATTSHAYVSLKELINQSSSQAEVSGLSEPEIKTENRRTSVIQDKQKNSFYRLTSWFKKNLYDEAYEAKRGLSGERNAVKLEKDEVKFAPQAHKDLQNSLKADKDGLKEASILVTLSILLTKLSSSMEKFNHTDLKKEGVDKKAYRGVDIWSYTWQVVLLSVLFVAIVLKLSVVCLGTGLLLAIIKLAHKAYGMIEVKEELKKELSKAIPDDRRVAELKEELLTESFYLALRVVCLALALASILLTCFSVAFLPLSIFLVAVNIGIAYGFLWNNSVSTSFKNWWRAKVEAPWKNTLENAKDYVIKHILNPKKTYQSILHSLKEGWFSKELRQVLSFYGKAIVEIFSLTSVDNEMPLDANPILNPSTHAESKEVEKNEGGALAKKVAEVVGVGLSILGAALLTVFVTPIFLLSGGIYRLANPEKQAAKEGAKNKVSVPLSDPDASRLSAQEMGEKMEKIHTRVPGKVPSPIARNIVSGTLGIIGSSIVGILSGSIGSAVATGIGATLIVSNLITLAFAIPLTLVFLGCFLYVRHKTKRYYEIESKESANAELLSTSGYTCKPEPENSPGQEGIGIKASMQKEEEPLILPTDQASKPERRIKEEKAEKNTYQDTPFDFFKPSSKINENNIIGPVSLPCRFFNKDDGHLEHLKSSAVAPSA